jgi:hypothetical protein
LVLATTVPRRSASAPLIPSGNCPGLPIPLFLAQAESANRIRRRSISSIGYVVPRDGIGK